KINNQPNPQIVPRLARLTTAKLRDPERRSIARLSRLSARHLRTKSVLVQAHLRSHSYAMVDREHVEPAGTLLHVSFAQESHRGSRHHPLLVAGHAQFRHGTRPNFDERQCLPVISDQVDLALDTSRHVVSGHKHVPMPPKIPISVRLATHAGASRPHLSIDHSFRR